MMMTLTKMKNMMVMMLTRMTMIKCDKMKMIKIMFSNLKKNALVPLPKISFIQIYNTKQQIIQDMNILITLSIEYFLPSKLFKRGWLNVHCVGLYYSNWILCLVLFSCVPSIDSTCFCVRRVYRGSIFFSLILILCICAYLGIKGDQFFSDFRIFFPRSFYIQIGVLQFVLPVWFYVKLSNFYAKLNVSNLYVTNLY
jgi:hypothetical protein